MLQVHISHFVRILYSGTYSTTGGGGDFDVPVGTGDAGLVQELIDVAILLPSVDSLAASLTSADVSLCISRAVKEVIDLA